MKKIIFVVIALLTFEVQAQTTLNDVTKDKVNMNSGGLDASKSTVFWGASTSSGVKGQEYLDTLWNSGNIKLVNGIQQVGGTSVDTISGVLLRYNVFRNEVEVLANAEKKDVRAIPGNQLKSFSTKYDGKPALFFNAQRLKTEKPLTGFYEVLAEGKLTLVKHFWVKTVKPSYNPAFSSGEKDTRINVEDDYYVISNNKVEKLNPGKKSIAVLMKDREEYIDKYLKDSSVNYKNEGDLVQLFQYYNK